MPPQPPPRAVSLFSGAGGLDIGLREAGFSVQAALEKDEHCCSTLRHNIDREGFSTRVIEEDIREVDPSSLRDSLGLRKGELDLLAGGPPCQSFSQIGKQKGIGDERGLLLFEMPRFAEAFEPRAVLVEQVKGLTTAPDSAGSRGGVLADLVEDFKDLGYFVSARVLNAADYGVPQARQRLFIVAMRCEEFEFPTPTHQPASDEPALFSLPPYQTAGDVLRLPKPRRKNGSIPANSHVDVTPAGDVGRITGVPEGEWLSKQLHLPPEQRGRLQRKDTTKFRRLSRREPSLTLRCGEIFFHPTQDRYLTPRECMRLHGYPDDYQLLGPVRGRSGTVKNLDQHRQVANSVPPPLGAAMARSVLSAMTWPGSQKYLVSA
jgi:DNA (cytosine-5)-methyltransferase 1